MYISLGCSKIELGCRSMLKFTLLEVGISFAASCPTMTSCSSASSRPLVTSSASSLRLSCDLNPPNYCSKRVPSRCHGRQIAFYSVYQEKGVGARTGRVVASKCDPYYVWGALVPVRLARISTIQECMQTLGKMWTPGTW